MTETLQIESPQALINRARFASKDFFTFVDDLISRVQLNFVTEFNDFVSSGLGQMLIDIVSWACETLSFYIDRQAAESYLETASLRRSVNRLARQLGYKMVPAVASSVDLEVNLTKVWAFDVPVPIGFQFQGPNGLIFEAAELVTFPTGEGPTSPARTISTREGVTIVENFTSDGTKNQAFRLTPGVGKYIAQDTAIITVAAAPWGEEEFITYDKTDQCEIDYNAEPPLLRFGDGVAGNIPAAGDNIRIEYIATSGKSGLVMNGTIEDVVTPLVVAFNTIGLTMTNPLPSSGGYDREELEETKRRVPFFFKARNVAVTREDYIGLSQAFTDPVSGTVAVAQAFVALGADDDLQLQILLDNIRAITNPLTAEINALTASAGADVASLTSARDTAESENADVATALGNIATASVTAQGYAGEIKQEGTKIESDVAEALTYVAAIPANNPSQLDVAERTAINNYLNGITGKAGTVKTKADDILGELVTVDDEQADALVKSGSVGTELTAMTPLLTSVQTDLDDIDDAMTNGFEAAIETELQAIYDHVDEFLAHDCKSNLVQVPIATKDADGFLVGPSTALIRSLQTYLTARKEVTQVVNVVSGEPFLVAAVIVGTIGIYEGYVQATVLSQVRDAIDDLLRDRKFGASLRLSDIYTAIAPDPLKGTGGIEGVKYAVLQITGPLANLNSSGNLIVTDSEVITKGSVTLTAEVAAA